MRPDWDEYFLVIAAAVSIRGDCSRRRVGAVIADTDHRIVATGYNGAPPGQRGCLAGACPRARSDVAHGSSYDTGPGACIAVHAEANALLFARQSVKGCTLYLTDAPCDGCKKLIEAAGIGRVVFDTSMSYRVLKDGINALSVKAYD